MSRINTFADRLDGWVNPIVVKELRQAVQGRFVMGILLIFLLVSVSALGVYAMQYEEGHTDFNDGREMFLFLWGVLVVAGSALIPLNASTRLSKELEANKSELLFSTTLSPGTIIRGKLFSSIILAVLIYTACLPFLTLTYLLRGIDVVSILMMLIYGLFSVFLAVQFTLFAASFSLSKAFKVVLGLGLLAGIGFYCIGLISSAHEMLRQGFFSQMNSWKQFWLPVSLTVGGNFVFCGLLYVLTVAMISPSSANRALPVRIYITATWLVAGGILGYITKDMSHMIPLEVWAIGTTSLLIIALMIGISEREIFGARLRKQIPRNMFLRIPTFFFYSGAASGVLWSLGLFSITLLILWAVKSNEGLGLLHENDLEASIAFMFTWILYCLGYGMFAVLIRRITWAVFGWRLRPTWAIALVLMVIFMVLPLLTGFFSGTHLGSRNAWMWYCSNPLAAFFYHKHINTFLTISIIFSGVTTLLNLPWFFGQMRKFKPLTLEPPPEDRQKILSETSVDN